MKKKLLILPLSLLSLSLINLAGCSNNSKIHLVFGDLTTNEVTTISYNKLKEKVDSEETFLLAIQYSDHCACWQSEAKPVIEKYISEKHVICYHIKLEELEANNNTFGIKIVTGNSSFAVFENGQVKNTITTKDDNTLKNYSTFESYMNELVVLPKFYYVNKDFVDELYKKDEKNVIYYSRSTCGDCGYLDSHYLKEWSKNNPDYARKIYVLDCDQPGIRLDENNQVNKEQWQKFKDDYGMSTVNNPTYGYDTGYVPTFLLIQGSNEGVKYLSGAVAFNDSVEASDGKYVVTNSYYTSERLNNLKYIDISVDQKVLKGMELGSADVNDNGTYVMWKHESAEKYHNIFVERFLKYSLN